MADEITPDVPAVTAQEAKTVGDENIEVREVPVEVNKDQVDAQVVQPREGDADQVNVHEVSIALDEVITDPSSPLAVQIPDAGRGSLDLPTHRLADGTVEEKFRAEADQADEPAPDES